MHSESVICDNCEEQTSLTIVDGGIGPIEVWGRPMVHSVPDLVTACCESQHYSQVDDD